MMFFADGVTYRDGTYRLFCEGGERMAPVDDAVVAYKWRITKPGGEVVSGLGKDVVLTTDESGEYRCDFTAYLDPAVNRCLPQEYMLNPIVSEAVATRILVGDTLNGPVVYRTLTNGNHQGYAKIGLREGAGTVFLDQYLLQSERLPELIWRVDGQINGSNIVSHAVTDVEEVKEYEVELGCWGPSGRDFIVLDKILIVVHSRQTRLNFETWVFNNLNTSWTTNLPAVFTNLVGSGESMQTQIILGHPEFYCGTFRWRDLSDLNSHYHPGAAWEIRSYITAGGHGHQATYNGRGHIIRSGLGAGTADFRAPISLDNWSLEHIDADVRPFIWVAQLDGNPVVKGYPYLALGAQYLNLNQALMVQGPNLSRYLELRPPQVTPGLKACEEFQE